MSLQALLEKLDRKANIAVLGEPTVEMLNGRSSSAKWERLLKVRSRKMKRLGMGSDLNSQCHGIWR